MTGFEPSAGMRRRSVYLVTDDEADERQVSGDYAPEGPMDHFRRAELWLPGEADAVLLLTDQLAWYGLSFQVGIVPPGTARITSADIRLAFEPPVSRLGAWEPNDRFATYRKIHSKAVLDVKAKLAVPPAALASLPGIADLLPQLSGELRKEWEATEVPHDSVVRTTSDGERRLAWQLREDPQTGIDPRHHMAQVVVGLVPGTAPALSGPLLTLEVECRSGILRMRAAVRQSIELRFRDV